MSDHNTFLVFKNVVNMVRVRGYNVDEFENIEDITLDDFKDYLMTGPKTELQYFLQKHGRTNFRSLCSITFIRDDDTLGHPKNITIFFSINEPGKAVSTTEIEFFAELIIDIKSKDAAGDFLFISSSELSSNFSKNLSGINLNETSIQTWMDDQFLFNPLKNKKLPITRLLSKKEGDILFKEGKLLHSQAPKNPTNEKIAKYFGAKEGQVMEYIRFTIIPGSIIKKEFFYRLVTSASDKNQLKVVKTAKIKA